jgi:photosystem II stability/assembly factor-like uncharacterized protein
MNINIKKGFITLTMGLLALAVINCSAVKTGNSNDLSQTTNIQDIPTTSTVQSSATVLNAVSLGQSSGILQLSVSEFQAEHFNASKGHFIISSVEVAANRANHHDSGKSDNRGARHDSDSEENDDYNTVWITVSDYGVDGKLYEIIPGDKTTYSLDTFLLPAGDYRKVRITLVDGQSRVLTLEGNHSVWHNVKTPSAKESGLKLNSAFTIENQMMTRVDFNLELEKMGTEHDNENHDNYGGNDHDNGSRQNENKNNGQSEHNGSGNFAYLIKPEIRFVSATITNLPVAGNVAYSPVAGVYNADQNVALTSSTTGATICYTTDGSLPSCNAIAACTVGNAYSGSIVVSSSQALNAIACKTGYMASTVTSSAYTIDKPPLTPGSFAATTVDSSQVNLGWSASTDDITAQSSIVYEICQSDVSGLCLNFTPVYTTTGGVTSYGVTGLLPATTYYFVIRAVDQAGNTSALSSEISITTGLASLWVVQKSAATNSILGSFYDGSEKIIVGALGSLFSSSDGINWLQEASPVGSNLNSVTGNGAGNYIVVGEGGVILYSKSLVSKAGNTVRAWSLIKPVTSVSLNSVVSNGKLFVAVGDMGAIVFSKDGISWLLSNQIVKGNLHSVTWSGTQYIAVGDAGMIITSLDGINWTISKYATLTDNLYGVASSNGSQVVVVGLNGAILVSYDGGKGFTSVNRVVSTLSDITWDGYRYIAVGDAGVIVTSLDGVNWIIEKTGVTANLKHASGKMAADGKIHDIVVGDFGTILTSP